MSLHVRPIRTAEASGRLAAEIRAGLESAANAGQFAAALGGFIANIVGPIPEEKWQEMVRTMQTGCDNPGCDCHTVSSKLFDALDELRTDWIGSRKSS
ncbi:MAG: hypothetical protein ACJ74Y_10755 [Bryobacteraceae bacterium]